MKSPIILAAMLLAAPAMGGGTTFIEKTPPTELEVCQINLRNMKDLMGQLQQQIASPPAAVAAPLPPAKPVAKAKAKPRACPPLKGRQKCKPGRTQSPKHNCKCGVWS